MATPIGWGLQMILLALFTLALFIYRKTFAYLFSSVNANTFTSRIVSDAARSQALGNSTVALPPVAYLKAQNWGRRRAGMIAGAAAGVPATGTAAPGATTDSRAPEDIPGEVGETTRVRGTSGYGRVRDNDTAPPLNVNRRNTGTGTDTSTRQGESRRTTDQAPSLAGNTSDNGKIPPRPAGGYTGTGDSGWASVFGTSGRSDSPPRNESGSSSGSGLFGGSSGNSRAAGAERPQPSTGRGIFGGREDTPAQGNIGSRGSRWGSPRERRERPAPPRQPRPAAPPASGGRGDREGGWLTGSDKRGDSAPITPFWGEGGNSTRDRKRDVPFWLNDD